MKQKRKPAGYTMVELIVVFALTAIFVACATTVIGAYITISSRITDLSHAQTVADTLLNEISSQVISLRVDDGRPAEDQVIIEEGSIAFENQDGERVLLQTDSEGLLTVQNLETGASYRPFGKEAYMDNRIETLRFEQKENGQIWVTLELQRDREQPVRYSASRIIACYNLA